MINPTRTGIEDVMRYDGICYYEDKEGNKYSLNGNHIEQDELCKGNYIYKVEEVKTGDGAFDYKYKVLAIRSDT